MSKVSFEDIGAVVATCRLGNNKPMGGEVVKFVNNAVVAPCSDGDAFCGLSMEPRDFFAAVQFKGFMTVGYTGELEAGWATLVANGEGGVRMATDADTAGVTALVAYVGLDGTAVICL